MKKTVLFLCTHNSARSQIAEGLVNSFFSDGYVAYSAGTKPAQVNPFAIQSMKEIGVDITNHYSKLVEQFYNKSFDYVITLCDGAKESCPTLPSGGKVIHKSFKDPSVCDGADEEKLNSFNDTREEIRFWLESNFR